VIRKERTVIRKLWGREEIECNTPHYCAKTLVLEPGFRSSLHYHVQKWETFIVKTGECELELNGSVYVLKPGQSVDLRPFDRHRFRAFHEQQCVILEVSTHDEPDDCVRLEPSRAL
jgi:mannose-6-phosphate isomerase-like protein (cupin superfamily)